MLCLSDCKLAGRHRHATIKPELRLSAEAHARAMAVTDASGHMLRFCQQVCGSSGRGCQKGEARASPRNGGTASHLISHRFTASSHFASPRPLPTLQCTRMHPLSEFQDAKRSCIAALKRRAQRKAALRDERRQEPAAAAAVQAPGSHSGTQSKAGKVSLPSAAADLYGSQQPPCAMVASAGAVSSDSGTLGSDFLSPLGGGSFHTDGSGSGTLGGSSGGQLPPNSVLLQQQPSELVHQQHHQQAHLLTAQCCRLTCLRPNIQLPPASCSAAIG